MTESERLARVEALEMENARLRNLCLQLESARDERDDYLRDLEEIGSIIGCNHVHDGLARCVRAAVEGDKDVSG